MLLTKKEAAHHLKMSLRTLETMMHEGTGPRFVKFTPRMVRFRMADLDAWVESQPSYTSTAQASKAS